MKFTSGKKFFGFHLRNKQHKKRNGKSVITSDRTNLQFRVNSSIFVMVAMLRDLILLYFNYVVRQKINEHY